MPRLSIKSIVELYLGRMRAVLFNYKKSLQLREKQEKRIVKEMIEEIENISEELESEAKKQEKEKMLEIYKKIESID